MKKIIFLITILLLAMSAECFADGKVNATVYPTRIYIKHEGQISEMDTLGCEVLNYNDKAYVPIRVLAEAVGADVNYGHYTEEYPYSIVSIHMADNPEIKDSNNKKIYIQQQESGVKASIFSCKVYIHIDEYEKEMDTTSNSVINYNDRSYIPLRVFAESMGFEVEFEHSSTEKPYNTITLNMPSVVDMPYNDVRGYVDFSVNYKEITGDDNGNIPSHYEANGLLKINKDLDNQYVQINILDSDNNILGKFDLNVKDTMLRPLKQGDLREYTAVFITKPGYKYQAEIIDKWRYELDNSNHGQNHDKMLGICVTEPVCLKSEDYVEFFNLEYVNKTNYNIYLEPVNLRFDVLKLNEDGSEEVVQSYTLPELKGKILKGSTICGYIPFWDKRDKNDKPVGAGVYFGRIVCLDKMNYYVEGSQEMQSTADFISPKESSLVIIK